MDCITGILKPKEIKELREIAAAGTFVDGQLTAGHRAKRVKKNEQLKKTDNQRKAIDSIVLGAFNRSTAFQNTAFPKFVASPMLSRYEPGMEYGMHVDNAFMRGNRLFRTDVSVTVFLSEPDSYDGGELIAETPYGEHAVKLMPGDAVVYSTTLLHRVAPVTRGERLAAVTWAQCSVRDEARRRLLNDLRAAMNEVGKSAPDSRAAELLQKTFANLLRMWAAL